MKTQIENLLEQNCRYIEINLKNNDTLSIYMPNQNKGNEITFVDDDNIVCWLQTQEDGCVYKTFVEISEISYVTGVYDCPQLVGSE